MLSVYVTSSILIRLFCICCKIVAANNFIGSDKIEKRVSINSRFAVYIIGRY